ncbi:hypothetical protein L596_024688 [Steinernema carpocapsae]|uniref:Uncharacterized protein n=1 Tax=Steinernema carpocapsae TaxID=34508 RepID=A0A4U5M5G6_STECR|nr:hypothetical protein L596_024688 [Steinernema carpocapsae]
MVAKEPRIPLSSKTVPTSTSRKPIGLIHIVSFCRFTLFHWKLIHPKRTTKLFSKSDICFMPKERFYDPTSKISELSKLN